MADFVHELEMKELINKLIDKGYGDIVDAFLLNDTRCYTKQGRLNKSGACRVLKFTPKELKDNLTNMKSILEGGVETELQEQV